MTPLYIGITTGLDPGKGAHPIARQTLDRRYVTAVEAAGGVPVLLPLTERREVTDALLALLHGVVIPGGGAIREGLVGTLPAELEDAPPARRASDDLWLATAARRRCPVLGICYGMQLINVARGGTLHGDVEHERAGAMPHAAQRGADRHPIDVAPGTWLAGALHAGRVEVNSRHFQAVARLGDDLRVAAVASDGVIEAIETTDGALLGVQFHPEALADATGAAVFRAFLDRCRRGRPAS